MTVICTRPKRPGLECCDSPALASPSAGRNNAPGLNPAAPQAFSSLNNATLCQHGSNKTYPSLRTTEIRAMTDAIIFDLDSFASPADEPGQRTAMQVLGSRNIEVPDASDGCISLSSG